jgi:ATP-dependent helicase HrpA
LNLEVPVDAFRPDSVPAHLRMNFRIVGDDERQLAMDRDLGKLKSQLAQKTEDILKEEASSSDAERHTGWTLGDLPEVLELERDGQTLIGYPALVDAGDAVTLQVFDAPDGSSSCARRESSTHAPQALEMLKDKRQSNPPKKHGNIPL